MSTKKKEVSKPKEEAPAVATSGDLKPDQETLRAQWLAASKKHRDESRAKQEETPVRVMRQNGGSVPYANGEGIVMDAKPAFTRDNKPYTMLHIFITAIHGNRAPDMLPSGISGMDAFLPVVVPGKDDGPEDKKKKDEPRAITLSDHHRTAISNYIRVSKFSDATGKPVSEVFVKGMPVHLIGLHAKIDGEQVYYNAKTVQAVIDPRPPFEMTKLVFETLSTRSVLERSAFALSACVGGFTHLMDAEESDPQRNATLQQAKVFSTAWDMARVGFAKSCHERGEQLRGDGMLAVADALDKHCERLSKAKTATFATGVQQFFRPHVDPTPDYPPLIASLVHDPQRYIGDSRLFALCDSPYDGPKTFVVPQVVSLEGEGPVLDVVVRLDFVGDASAFSDAMKSSGFIPAPDSKGGCLAFKIMLRDTSPSTGLIIKPKVHDFLRAVFKVGKWAAVTRVQPRQFDETGVVSPFVEGITLDVPTSIERVAVRVSEAFAKASLCPGGDSQYVLDELDDVEVLQDKEKNPLRNDSNPKLHSHCYQEITASATFKFENAKMPSGRTTRVYRVWFAGSDALVSNEDATPNPSDDTEEGEKAVKAAADEANMTVNAFLLQRGAVYCLAVESPHA
jgi:hypothetical protein